MQQTAYINVLVNILSLMLLHLAQTAVDLGEYVADDGA